MRRHFGDSFLFVDGTMAVLIFFIISGFYMSLVINEKYARGNADGWKKRFYLNRALRIYPVYFAALALTLVCWRYLGMANVFMGELNMPKSYQALLAFVNILLVGMDIAFFMGRAGVEPAFLSSYPSGFPIYVAWSIGVELTFYLLAPYIVRQGWKGTAGLLLLFGGVRALLYLNGFGQDSWLTILSIGVMVFFVLGHSGYLLYKRIQDWKYARETYYILLGTALATLAVTNIGGGGVLGDRLDYWRNWLFYILMVVTIPFLFKFTKDSKVDDALGQLSYPLYVAHPLAILIGVNIPWKNADYLPFGTLALTLGLALGLHMMVERPLERLRDKVRGGVPVPHANMMALYKQFRAFSWGKAWRYAALFAGAVALSHIVDGNFKPVQYVPDHAILGDYWKGRAKSETDPSLGRVPLQLPGPMDVWAGGEAKEFSFNLPYSGESSFVINLLDSHESAPPKLEIWCDGKRNSVWEVPKGNGGFPHQWMSEGKRSSFLVSVNEGASERPISCAIRSVSGSWIALGDILHFRGIRYWDYILATLGVLILVQRFFLAAPQKSEET
jgi:peptidoglycan/LPS O-acetylase OafA/YrhL